MRSLVSPVPFRLDATLANAPALPARVKSHSARAITAACMLAVSPATLALAQDAPAEELPAIVVEGQKAKAKKKPVAAKKAPAAKVVTKQAAPVPQPPPAEPVETTAGGGAGGGEPGANPYANPDAPYMVEKSGSGKITQPLADTPRTVTAIPKDVIRDKGATDLRELARQTPGVTIHAGENGAAVGSNFEIRGFNARNDIFVDGIRDPGSIGRDVFSIDQLEIYKGPSGTLSGRATPGGAFNFISKQPVLGEDFYEVDTRVGTDETFRTTIDANKSFSRDFAARANLMYNEGEVAGRDFVEDERWGGLLSLGGRVSESLTVNLDYYRYRRDGIPDFGVPVSRVERKPFTELGLDRDTFYGELGLDYAEDESDVGTARVVAKLSEGVTLSNITRYGENYSAYIASAPRPAAGQDDLDSDNVNITNPQRIQDTSLFATQTSLNIKFNTGMFRHEVVAGIEYSREDMARSSHEIVATGIDPTAQPFRNPDPYRNSRDWTGNKIKQFDALIEDVGYYIGDTVHLTDQWIVNGGIRFDDFSRDQVAGPTAAATNTASVDQNLFSWNVGIVYKPIPIASFYAAYATAESPIGNEIDSTSSEYNGLTSVTAGLPPEETRGIEVGTKWELFNRRLLATAALFETVKDNARTNRGVNLTATPPVTLEDASAGEYRVRGIEFGVSGNITDKWSVFGGVVFMDTEVLDSDVEREIGRRLANTPLTQFALLTKYQVTPQLSVGGQAIYQGEIVTGHFAENDFSAPGAANQPNGPAYTSVDYWRFDAMAEYEFNEHWSVSLLGTNLTDEVYYDAVYQAQNTFAFVAPGRAGYLGVKWKY
jgi:catecholate siderophore receptor